MALFKRSKKEKSKKADKSQTAGKDNAPVNKKETSMKDLYSKDTGDTGKDTGKDKKDKVKTDADKVKTGAKDKHKDKKHKDKGESKQQKETPKKAYRVLVKPLITEKVGDLAKENKYVFEVANNVNKLQVAEAIREVYEVKPIKINIITIKGKRVRMGRILGKRKDRKKAIVKIPKGKTINIYEGV